MPSSIEMAAEAIRLIGLKQYVEASELTLDAARASADEAGYTDIRCGCGRFVARNELRCWEVLGHCSVCFAEPERPLHP
jgi:hypothetical protein